MADSGRPSVASAQPSAAAVRASADVVRASADVVVVGAGIVGAACAYYASRAGLSVAVLDAGPIVGGTTGAGEGNILLSDKEPGPELDLGLLSHHLWLELSEELATTRSAALHGRLGAEPGDGLAAGPASAGGGRLGAEGLAARREVAGGGLLDAGLGIELEAKGGLMVAGTPAGLDALHALAERQAAAGVTVERLDPAGLAEREPRLVEGLAGGVFYEQDLQVQPMLAAARLLAAARANGATVHPRTPATGIRVGAGGRVTGVQTPDGVVATTAVVNAAGTWAAEVARLAGVNLPISPRRGFVLVTEPLPPLIRHKVYSGDYVGDVAADTADLQSSPVIEGTPAGTILIGASRERVGFDPGYPLAVLRRLAAQAVALFPFLADVRVLRAYRGFRPYSRDHLPVIGADPRVPGLFHACGHEGAGIGLAPGTGALIAAALRGETPPLPLTPFRPDRFADVHSERLGPRDGHQTDSDVISQPPLDRLGDASSERPNRAPSDRVSQPGLDRLGEPRPDQPDQPPPGQLSQARPGQLGQARPGRLGQLRPDWFRYA